MTESIHKFTTTFHLPDFCQLSFFVIYVSFHTFRIYTRYRSFGLFIPVFAFHQLITYGHPTPRIAAGLLFVTKNIVQICKIYRFMKNLPSAKCIKWSVPQLQQPLVPHQLAIGLQGAHLQFYISFDQK